MRLQQHIALDDGEENRPIDELVVSCPSRSIKCEAERRAKKAKRDEPFAELRAIV